jgi:hypothetical protein
MVFGVERCMSVGADRRVTSTEQSTALRQVVWSSALGSMLEWYDFLVYGAAAALLFNKAFSACSRVVPPSRSNPSTVLFNTEIVWWQRSTMM